MAESLDLPISERARTISEASSLQRKLSIKKGSITSQVTFASLFGDEGDEQGSVSSEQTHEVNETDLPVRPSKCNLIVEHIMLLFLWSSSLSREILKRILVNGECGKQFSLNSTQCDDLFNKNSVRLSEIVKLTEYLIDARISVEYVVGVVFIFLLSQYFVRHGYKQPMMFCLTGAIITQAITQILLRFSSPSKLYVTFVAALPLIITGGDVLMMTSVCVHIGTNSIGKSSRRWRFFLFEIFSIAPDILAHLTVALWTHLNISNSYADLHMNAVLLSIMAILQLYFYQMEMPLFYLSPDSEYRPLKTFNLTAYRQTLRSFTKRRPNHSRKQIFLILSIVASSAINLGIFSDVRQKFFSQRLAMSRFEFVVGTCGSLSASFLVAVAIEGIMIFWIRPLDPSVILAGVASLLLSNLLYAAAGFYQISYYIGISLMPLIIVGRVAVKSHLCQMVDKHEYAPLFGMLFAIERTVHIVCSIGWRFVFTELLANNDFNPSLIFVIQAALMVWPLIGATSILYITKTNGYPYYALVDP